VFARKPQNIAEPFGTLSEWEPMRTVVVDYKPAPDNEVQRNEQEEIRCKREPDPPAVGFKVQASLLLAFRSIGLGKAGMRAECGSGTGVDDLQTNTMDQSA
jgi:hypothetical protein